jgi:hypothetical protein
MGCLDCRKALAEQTGTFADRIHAASDEPCGCERHSLSDLSPGVVCDNESLCFIISDPDGMGDGGVNPILLQRVHSGGLSVLRATASTEEFAQTLEELRLRWAASVRSFAGIVAFDCSAVRHSKGERLCCVFDTAVPGKPHHADIVSRPAKVTEGRKEKLSTKRLAEAMGSRFETPSKFRGGALALYRGNDGGSGPITSS